jgi:putative transposon-encoded protein
MREIAGFELHISGASRFTVKYGKQVKQIGGKYSRMKPTFGNKRYVDIPNTFVGRKLVDAIMRDFGNEKRKRDHFIIIKVAGYDPSPSWVNVTYKQTVKEAIEYFEKAEKNWEKMRKEMECRH